MQIFDGQIHLWMPNSPDHPWVPGARNYQGDQFLIEEAIELFDREGVDGAVVVTPSWVGTDNSYGIEAAQRFPDRFAVMGRFDYQAEDAEDRLTHWKEAPGMLGIRATVIDPVTEPMFRDPENHWFWERCGTLNIPLMCYPPKNIDILAPVAQRAKDLRIIVDHSGRFAQGPKDDAAWEDLPTLLDLARFDNVAVKVSSLPSFSTQPFPFENLHPHIRAIHGAFGSDRMIWGSDVTRLNSTYDENIRLFAEALDFLSEDDKEKIFARNLTRWCDAKFAPAQGGAS